MFRPWTLRELVKDATKTIEKWDSLGAEERESGIWINPDEPVLITVPNPECDQESLHVLDDEDADGNHRHLHFHVMSVGGGGDADEDGNEIGHDGFSIDGMLIDEREYLCNGRRRTKP
jgi:hypothetical protein